MNVRNFEPDTFRDTILHRYPSIPLDALDRITLRESNRPEASRLTPESYTPLAIAAVSGFIRHNLTDYDALLARHYMRYHARDKVRNQVNYYITLWSLRP